MEEINSFKGEEVNNKPIIDITNVHVNNEVEGRRKTEVDTHGTVDSSKINVGNWAIGPYRKRDTTPRSVSGDTTVRNIEVENNNH